MTTEPTGAAPLTALENHLRGRRDAGRRLLVPYVTGGITPGWARYAEAYAAAGADAVEIGLPFSDPMLDGATIQEASFRALERGTTPDAILDELSTLDLGVPTIVMAYANTVLRGEGFCARLAAAGVRGLIVPDVPCDEVGPLADAADAAGVALVLLAAPATMPARLRTIVGRSRGFVYAVTVMGTTGERTALAGSARSVASRLRALTTLPVLAGFGVSTPAHAAEAAGYADGVVVASSLMRRVLAGADPTEVGAEVATMRAALDNAALDSAGP